VKRTPSAIDGCECQYCVDRRAAAERGSSSVDLPEVVTACGCIVSLALAVVMGAAAMYGVLWLMGTMGL